MTGPKRVAEKQLALSRWNALTRLLRVAPASEAIVGPRHAVAGGPLILDVGAMATETHQLAVFAKRTHFG